MFGSLSRPAILLRYGSAKDRHVIKMLADRKWVDGLVVPGNILAYQAVATPHYVRAFRLPYLIDPMSYVFARKQWFWPGQEMRPSIKRLLERHGEAAERVCDHESRGLQPKDLTPGFVDSLTESTIKFQQSAVAETPSRRIAQYFKFLQREPPSPTGEAPVAIVAPYFFIDGDDRNLAWLAPNLSIVERLAAADIPVAAVLFYDARLSQPSKRALWNKVIAAYQQCKAGTVLLWPENLRDDFEESEGEGGKGLAEIVDALAKAGKEVMSLYGGYYSLLLHSKGMAGVSHGMLYTQHKSVEAAGAAAGPPPVRYYFPEFHQFRSIAQAVRIIQAAKLGVPCNCEICSEVFRGDPDNIARFQDPSYAIRHFMAVRRAEADRVAKTDIAELREELQSAYEKWHHVVSALPNPDSSFGALMRGLDHLNAWIAALSS